MASIGMEETSMRDDIKPWGPIAMSPRMMEDLRGVFALVFENHPYRALADFRRVALRRLHCSILSMGGASGKPEASQNCRASAKAKEGGGASGKPEAGQNPHLRRSMRIN